MKNEITQLLIYPNPANNFITVQSKNQLLSKIIINDGNGRILLVTEEKESPYTLDLRNFAKGEYQISVTINNKTIVKNITIN